MSLRLTTANFLQVVYSGLIVALATSNLSIRRPAAPDMMALSAVSNLARKEIGGRTPVEH